MTTNDEGIKLYNLTIADLARELEGTELSGDNDYSIEVLNELRRRNISVTEAFQVLSEEE